MRIEYKFFYLKEVEVMNLAQNPSNYKFEDSVKKKIWGLENLELN